MHLKLKFIAKKRKLSAGNLKQVAGTEFFSLSLFADDFGAKGQQGDFGNLEMLQTKGDTDNGAAEAETDNQMGDSHFNATKNNPENIQQDGAGLIAVDNLLAEGEKAEFAEFEALQSYRYAHNGNTPQQTNDKPEQSCKNTAKQEPDDITNDAHKLIPPLSVNNIMLNPIISV